MSHASSSSRSPLLRLLREGIADGLFPGAVFRAGRPGKVLAEGSTGTMGSAGRTPPMARDAIFDVASLTKPLITATAVMQLLEENTLTPETLVRALMPEFEGDHKERVTVGHLLEHSSGLPSWAALYLRADRPEQMLQALHRIPLETIPGQRTQYSCLGYILLGQLIEQVTGRSLDEYAAERILRPLRMYESLFRPPTALVRRIPPTDMNCYFERKMTGAEGAQYTGWVKGITRGVPNDGNARTLGGVAGNSGLFATAADVSRFAEMMLRRGSTPAGQFLQPETIALMTRDRGQGRAYGWETRSAGRLNSSGRSFSIGSYGHSGFPGTSLWIDPVRDLYVILLTNRTFFGPESSGFPRFRRRFNDQAIDFLEGGAP